MLPIYPGGHAAYQKFVVEQLRNHYAYLADLPDTLLDIAEHFLLDYYFYFLIIQKFVLY